MKWPGIRRTASSWMGGSLRRDAIYFGMATLAERGASILLLPVLAKSLPQALYGVWSQITVSVALCSGILLLGLSTAVVRYFPEEIDPDRRRRLVHGMLMVVATTSAIGVAGSLLFATPLSRLVFGDESYVGYARLLGVFWAVEALFELVAGVIRASLRIAQVARYYFTKNVIRLGALALGLFVLRFDLARSLVLVLAMQAVLILWMYGRAILPEVGEPPTSLGHPRWREIAAFSLPLLPYGVLTWANAFLNRYFLLHYRDLDTVGAYAFAYSLASIAALFYSIPGFVLYPHLVDRWGRGDRRGAGQALQQTSELYLLTLLPFLVVLAMFTKPMTLILATHAYIAPWPVALSLGASVGMMGLYQLHLYGTLLAKRTLANLISLAVTVFINITLNRILIPPYGMLGAAAATVASNGVLAGATIALSYQVLPYGPSRKFLLGASIAAGAMVAFIWAARGIVASEKPLVLGLIVVASLAVYMFTRQIGWLALVKSR